MKKLKWILLFIMLLLAVVFLFATCKKTNAYYDGIDYGKAQYITLADSNSGLLCSYYPEWESSTRTIAGVHMTSGNYFEIYTTVNITNNSFVVYLKDSVNGIVFSTNNINPRYVRSIDVIFGANYDVNNSSPFAINIRICYLKEVPQTGASQLMYDYDNYIFNSSSWNYQTSYELNSDYTSQNGLRIVPIESSSFTGPNYFFLGTYNIFSFDVLDYSDTLSEARDDIYEDYLLLDNNEIYLYNYAYQLGYSAGYQLGYDDGYAAGQTAGYNAGYQAGYNAGVNDNQEAFDRGYNDGYADGYASGTVHGYDEGYETGYNIGFDEGLAGATPVSQTVTLLGSIFGSIGTVLSIQLFPGFTLGLLILVPLFFAVLGLILWIWRRN